MKTFEKHQIAQFTTFKIGGIANRICFPVSIEELVLLMEEVTSKNEPWTILGGGSNVVVSSNELPGTVICTTGLNFIEQIAPDLLLAGSGVRLPRLSAYAAKLVLSGMEFWEGIPGTVGGSIIMNAGAHGSSASQILESVKILNLKTGKIEDISSKDIIFNYRTSSIKVNEHIVLSAIFKVLPGNESVIRAKMKENNLARQRSQPIKEPSAGCIFSNPIEVNMPAGKMLDSIGAKKLTIGSAQVSEMHANFVINLGEAKSQDVCKLINKLQTIIHENYNITLKPEVKPIGVFNKEEAKIWTQIGIQESNSFIISKA